MRFTTVELSDLEDRISRAGERALAIELELFDDLAGEVLGRGEEIAHAARAIAELDVAAGLAELAVVNRYCRPSIDDSTTFGIVDGRHPVLDMLEAEGTFVPNDTIAGSPAESGEQNGQVVEVDTCVLGVHKIAERCRNVLVPIGQ